MLQVAALGLAIIAGRLVPGDRDPTTELVGGVMMAAGVVLGGWALITLRGGRAFTAVPRPRDGAQLVDNLVYVLLSNEIYTGMILVAFGWAVVRWSAPAIVASVVLAVVLDLKRRREEIWLLERYPGYAAYRSRTRALVPLIY